MKTIEIKIPDNTQFEKAEVIGGMLVTSFKDVEKFNRGDIIYRGRIGNHVEVVIICGDYLGRLITQLALYRVESEEIPKYSTGIEPNTGERLATDSEKQLLFNALAKEGKYWDTEALEVKDFLKVPESIGIYSYSGVTDNGEGDGLYIGFNDNKQMLWVNTNQSIYCVTSNIGNDKYDKVDCYLKSINFEDIKVGDTILFYYSPNSKNNLHQYVKVLYSNNGIGVAGLANEMCISTNHIKKDSQCTYYKLIPIQ